MSTDRELLELSAKAAGYNTGHHWNAERLRLIPPVDSLVVILPDGQYHTAWNPLTDDGDALRLANKLRLYIGHTMFGCPDAPGTALVGVDPWRQGSAPLAYERFSGPSDQDAATRRAIVRAAAEIGRAMP